MLYVSGSCYSRDYVGDIGRVGLDRVVGEFFSFIFVFRSGLFIMRCLYFLEVLCTFVFYVLGLLVYI